MYRLVISELDLAQALARLQRGEAFAQLDADILYIKEGVELLAHPPLPGKPSVGRLLVLPDSESELPPPDRDRVCVRLLLNWQATPATVRGMVRWLPGRPWEPLDSLRVIGEAMRDIPLVSTPAPFDEFDFERQERLSRLIGAAGGAEIMDALQEMRITVIGCGGLGSVLAEQLARLLGPEGRLDLLDPDVLELPNLACWLIPDRDHIGEAKVDVLARHLKKLPATPGIHAHRVSVGADDARGLLKPAQCLACCVDSPGARLAAGFYAAVYARPLLVVETGVFLGDNSDDHRKKIIHAYLKTGAPGPLYTEGPRMRQADVRLILPQRGACLLCAGGIGGKLEQRKDAEPFWRRRAGTLMALNLEAVGRAVRLLLAWLNHEVTQTTHLRLDEAAGAMGEWRESTYFGRRDCPLCARLGRGDAARDDLEQVIRHLWERGM